GPLTGFRRAVRIACPRTWEKNTSSVLESNNQLTSAATTADAHAAKNTSLKLNGSTVGTTASAMPKTRACVNNPATANPTHPVRAVNRAIGGWINAPASSTTIANAATDKAPRVTCSPGSTSNVTDSATNDTANERAELNIQPRTESCPMSRRTSRRSRGCAYRDRPGFVFTTCRTLHNRLCSTAVRSDKPKPAASWAERVGSI